MKYLTERIKKILYIYHKRKHNTKISTRHFNLDLIIGDNCLIGKNVYLEKNVKIGNFTYMNCGNSHISIDSDVEIGSFCSIAPGVNIAQGNHYTDTVSTHPFLYNKYYKETFKIDDSDYKKIGLKDKNLKTYIGNDVWIGINAIIKRGIKIGDGAIIGAGSVVTKDVPDYAVIAGVPGKIISYRFSSDCIQRLKSIERKWWTLDQDELSLVFGNMYDINDFLNVFKDKE